LRCSRKIANVCMSLTGDSREFQANAVATGKSTCMYACGLKDKFIPISRILSAISTRVHVRHVRWCWRVATGVAPVVVIALVATVVLSKPHTHTHTHTLHQIHSNNSDLVVSSCAFTHYGGSDVTIYKSLSLRFNGHFPGEPGLVGVY